MNHRGRNPDLQLRSKIWEDESTLPESFDKEDKDGDAYQEEEESRLTKALEDEKKMKSLEATNRAPHYIYIYTYDLFFICTCIVIYFVEWFFLII